MKLLARLVKPIADLRDGEGTTALLMFLYSFLAMTSYNIVKPITRSEFISSLGADNLPWVQFASGIIIGLIMQAYSKAIAVVPRRWTIPVTQAGMVGLLVLFWFLFTTFGDRWVSVGFYLMGLILGVLLISQFWTLANDIYDPRQAKRIFGFIGGGSSLGGITGGVLTKFLVESLGTHNMLLVSAVIMAACLGIVVTVVRRENQAGDSDASKTGEEDGVGGGEAIQLLRSSKHLQIIAAVIAFAAVGAAIIEQQLNMAAAEAKGATNSDGIAAFLAEITIYLSAIGLFIQMVVTSRIHRMLGIGFALLVLPVSLGSTAIIMLLNRALWAPGLARVLDTSLRYTVDKTSREILFLPLPADLKYRAKPFIDVTIDRFAKGIGALLILVLIKDWGLGLDWQQLSYASLVVMGLWIVTAMRARNEYLRTFRRSIEQQDVSAADVRSASADLSSIETLVTELAHPEPRRVLYAMDLLDSLDKRQLVTPLLLRHESADVRVRALRVAKATGPAGAERWQAGVERALGDDDGEVRLAAARALATIRGEAAVDVMRPYLSSPDANLALTAAAALAASPHEEDVRAAEQTFERMSGDTRESSADLRRQVARALGLVSNPRFRPLLVPLMYDSSYLVARAAINSAGSIGGDDFLFVPTLVALMRNRRLKAPARKVLVEYGEAVVPPLAYFMHDQDEDIWVRRHVPGTLALIPSAAAVAALVGALDEPDGFLRYKAIAALGRLRRDQPELTTDATMIERHVLAEASRAFDALTLHHNLFVKGGLDATSLLARTLTERHRRAVGRTFALLALMYPPADIAAVQATLQVSDVRTRSGAIEYLDNVLKGKVRQRVMLLIEDMPADERIRKGNVLYRTRERDVEDTLAQLVHDASPITAAVAIHLVAAHRLPGLTDDLERIVAHAATQDRDVAEAATWALARTRQPQTEPGQRWQTLPAVELADRLRHLAIFSYTSVDELFRIGGVGRQVRHEQGRQIYQRGASAFTVQFLLDGQVRLTNADSTTAVVDAPFPLAFDEVLEGRPMQRDVMAVTPSICLALTNEEFLSVLAENVALAEGIYRWLIETHRTADWQTVVKGTLTSEIEQKVSATGLQPVDRVLLMQVSPLLASATGAQLMRLAAISRPVALKAGHNPFSGHAESAMLVVLTGTVAVEGMNGQTDTADPGDVIGMYETLGGTSITAKVVATTDGSALRINRSDIFDLLADETDLFQSIFSGLKHGPQ